MGRSIHIAGIALYARIAPCAHHCRYCLLGEKKLANISFSRFAALVDRFIDWKQQQGMKDFDVFHWVRFSYDFDIVVMTRWIKLWERLGRCPDMLLGGLPLRPEDELRTWLLERKKAGIQEVHASFAGYGEFHDRWNGRKGDFEFQMKTLQIAAELGMELSQRLFVTNSTLPLLDGLLDKLEAIPAKIRHRYLSPFFYMGFAKQFEGERITEKVLDRLPERLMRLYRANKSNWRSERSWMEAVRTEEEAPEEVMLRLEPDEFNIDRLEALSCEEITADLERQTRAAYRAIPSRRELCEQAGDPDNIRIYALRNDIERKWLDRYLDEHPVRFNRLLTHLAMVR